MITPRQAVAAAGLILLQASLTWMQPVSAQELTSVFLDKQPVFNIVLGAGGMSAAQRAAIIQRKLDAAINADNRSCQQLKVSVGQENGAPAVLLNQQVITTIDKATAKAAGTTPEKLAQTWADSLRDALNEQTTTRTLSAIVGGTTSLSPAMPYTMRFARLPEGTLLRVALDADVHTATLRPGEGIAAHLVCDLLLPGGVRLTRGTRIFGDVSSLTPDSMWGPAPMRVDFDRVQLASGEEIPLSTSIVVGSSRLQGVIIQPGCDQLLPLGMPLTLELGTAVQLAVTGTTM